MYYNSARQVGEKMTNLLADSRILRSDWKFWVPFYLAQQPYQIVVNAKNLADGINEAIELYGIEIAPEMIAVDRYEGRPKPVD